jgi:hypothetical protein
MEQFQFRVHGLTEEELRRWRRLNRRFTLSGSVMVWAAALVAIAYLSHSTTPVMIESTEFKGRSVMVIEDNSGSMKENDRQAKLKAQLDQLQAAGVDISGHHTSVGFGARFGGAQDNLLNSLKKALSSDPAIDTIYVFSDFDPGPADESDEAGYLELRRILGERGLRLYLGTVDQEPSNEFVTIARESGGDVIKSR